MKRSQIMGKPEVLHNSAIKEQEGNYTIYVGCVRIWRKSLFVLLLLTLFVIQTKAIQTEITEAM